MSWGTLSGEVKVEGDVEPSRHNATPGRRFLDQNVIVTGGGRGFGRIIAQALAREGANVCITYNSSSTGANQTVEEIGRTGVKSFAVKADITNWGDVKQMAESVWTRFGRVDILINNAGDVSRNQMSWREITEEAIDQTLSVDIKGTLFCIHEIGKRMLETKSGTIVNVCSNVIVTGSSRAPQYAASKYGVLGLTKSYALAFAPYVRVNAACPGYMDTESTTTRKDWTPHRRKWIVDHTPLRRIGRAEDIVPIILFLASDDSIHMTGNIVMADGGFSMPGA
jgi:NAD(P)-dependent dehydrogenase (short-subunit alcohol dehydrogenase family)